MKCWEINTPTGPITASFEILKKFIGSQENYETTNINETIFVKGFANIFSISNNDWQEFLAELRDRKISKIVD
jgi:hypothetical protein